MRFLAVPTPFLVAMTYTCYVAGIIHKVGERIKALPPSVPLLLCIFVVGFLSFGMGRLSVLSAQAKLDGSVSVNMVAAAAAPMPPGGLLVASRSGKKYHFPWCPGADTIAEKNKIWFKDEQEARRRGYTPAGNCKGLE